MPGTPNPVLGSERLTLVVGVLVGTIFVILPRTLADYFSDPFVLAVVGGATYALVCLLSWFGARGFAGSFASAKSNVWAAALLAGPTVLGAQAAIPYYFYARWEFLAPLAVLFVVTVLLLPPLLSVRGESDPLALYAFFFGPMLIGGTLLVALVEFGVRRFVVGA